VTVNAGNRISEAIDTLQQYGGDLGVQTSINTTTTAQTVR
jgi:hypothetical protein